MTQPRETYLAWLKTAHAMESQALTMLNGQSARLDDYPELRARIDQHIDETESQAAALERLIEQHGEGTSAIKDMMGSMAAMGQAVGGSMTSDEVVKGAIASYAFEHMEIATYRSLIASADAIGDTEAKHTLTSILQQEVAMASWLEDHIPAVTREFLMRDAHDMAEAKR